jgi:hypothetical protein
MRELTGQLRLTQALEASDVILDVVQVQRQHLLA